MSRALELDENLPVSNARKIVDTLNRIMHGYEKISDKIIWDIVQTDLPILKEEATNLLNN